MIPEVEVIRKIYLVQLGTSWTESRIGLVICMEQLGTSQKNLPEFETEGAEKSRRRVSALVLRPRIGDHLSLTHAADDSGLGEAAHLLGEDAQISRIHAENRRL